MSSTVGKGRPGKLAQSISNNKPRGLLKAFSALKTNDLRPEKLDHMLFQRSKRPESGRSAQFRVVSCCF